MITRTLESFDKRDLDVYKTEPRSYLKRITLGREQWQRWYWLKRQTAYKVIEQYSERNDIEKFLDPPVLP